jgi:thiosulfate dehydrogenase [quinone] large subunit
MKDRWTAYAIFRLALGVNIFIHGVVRISGSGAHEFASKTTQSFLPTFLPIWSVFAFLIVLPFVEAALGALMALGLLTKWSLVAGSLLMVLLIFGTALRSDWATLGVQMIYSITYYLLLSHLRQNELSVDAFFLRKGLRNAGVRHER